MRVVDMGMMRVSVTPRLDNGKDARPQSQELRGTMRDIEREAGMAKRCEGRYGSDDASEWFWANGASSSWIGMSKKS